MLANVLDSLKEDRAKFARNVEYVKETACDDILDERMEVAESLYTRETYEELQEAAGLLEQMDIEDELMSENVEVERIMKAEDNITFNEMVGIE